MTDNEKELKKLQAQMKRVLTVKSDADETLRMLNRKITEIHRIQDNKKILIT